MNSTASDLPAARVERGSAGRGAWLLPLSALAFALFLAFNAFLAGGPAITIPAAAGPGVGVGDPLRYRGVNVGEVEEVSLTEDLQRVALAVRLDPQAAGLCREGSRFWIVRPQMSLDSVQGLETIVGARYLTVAPGELDSPERYEFEALDEAPVTERVDEAGLELRLVSRGPARLARGAEVTHRGIVVGSVLSVELASDGSRVEVDVYVRPEARELVRSNTRFWSTGGLEVSMALAKGLSIEVDSLRSLVIGGVALATPTRAGAATVDGQRFVLEEGPPEGHEAWQPLLAVGDRPGPDPLQLDSLRQARASWEEDGLIDRQLRREGWVVRVPRGLLGPQDLLAPAEVGEREDLRLFVDGEALASEAPLAWESEGLGLRELSGDPTRPLVAERVRFAPKLQDILLFSDPSNEPLPLSRSRLVRRPRGWLLDAELELPPGWHGALAFGLDDRRWIGMLLLEEEGARLVPFQAGAW